MNELTSRQKQAIESRDKIFRCAMKLFAEYSYEKVTIKDICKKAEISVGGFYHYFSNKFDILNEGYRLFDELTMEHFEEHQVDSPIEKIFFLMEEQCKSIEELGVAAFTQLYKGQLTSNEKYILNTERFFYHAMKESILQAVEQNLLYGDTDEITTEILAVSRGLIYDWIMHEGKYDMKIRTLKIVKILLEHYEKKNSEY